MFSFIEFEERCRFITLDDYSVLDGLETEGTYNLISGEINEKRRLKSDFLYISPGLIAGNDKAKNFFEEFYREQIQVFPIRLKKTSEPYYIFSALDVFDVLDHDESEVIFYRVQPSRVKRIDKYVFKSEPRVTGIFKIPETKNVEVLCDESFKERYAASGLAGLRFVECSAE